MAFGFEVKLDNFGQVEATYGPRTTQAVVNRFHVGLRKAVVVLRDEVRRGYTGIYRPGWRKLSGVTIQQKGHDLRLFETGNLADNVRTVEKRVSTGGIRDVIYDIGFIAKDAAKIAQIHERGATIKVTARMRNYLATRGVFLKKTTRFLVIPARKNFEPAFKLVAPEMTKIVGETVKNLYRKG